MKMLEHEGIALEGKNVVVVGASNIVGKPMALMLMQRDTTVAICHAKTRDLAQFTLLADILVVAAGCPNLILPMVRTGADVIAREQLRKKAQSSARRRAISTILTS